MCWHTQSISVIVQKTLISDLMCMSRDRFPLLSKSQWAFPNWETCTSMPECTLSNSISKTIKHKNTQWHKVTFLRGGHQNSLSINSGGIGGRCGHTETTEDTGRLCACTACLCLWHDRECKLTTLAKTASVVSFLSFSIPTGSMARPNPPLSLNWLTSFD